MIALMKKKLRSVVAFLTVAAICTVARARTGKRFGAFLCALLKLLDKATSHAVPIAIDRYLIRRLIARFAH